MQLKIYLCSINMVMSLIQIKAIPTTTVPHIQLPTNTKYNNGPHHHTITKLLKIEHPILLAGMGPTAGSNLVAAISNAGGLGVLGGLGYKPQMLCEAFIK